jgi:predicted dehydrogenase
MKQIEERYNWLSNINSLDFRDKSALVIGGSEISRQYILALLKFKIKDITVVTKSGDYISKICKENDIKLFTGGFENNLSNIGKKDIVIVAPTLDLTINATKLAIQNGQQNILIEKPGSLYVSEFELLEKLISTQNIRVGYNRLVYPNLHKVKTLVEKEGGITSCRFTFTERISSIDFKKKSQEIYHKWGISNSLHVITMAFELIGMPKEIFPRQYGQLEWHPTGSIFVGAGISERNIPFSYHADWGSGGRWGIEVNTANNSYQLIPLEEIFVCPKDTGSWKKIDFKKSFSEIKQGISEEIAVMLSVDKKYQDLLPDLKKASRYNKLAENIFGYN